MPCWGTRPPQAGRCARSRSNFPNTRWRASRLRSARTRTATRLSSTAGPSFTKACSAPVCRPDRQASPGPDVLNRLVALEQIKERAQRLAALGGKRRVAGQHQARVVMRDRDQLLVRREVGKPQRRQTALPRAEHLAAAAQPEVFFGDAEPVL